MSAGEVVLVGGILKFDTGEHYAEVSCKHQKHGACGGCYARVFFALVEIHNNPTRPMATVVRVFDEMKADKR